MTRSYHVAALAVLALSACGDSSLDAAATDAGPADAADMRDVGSLADASPEPVESEPVPPPPARCSSDVRAVWIDYRTHCTSDEECEASFAALREQGFNRVYMHAFNNGVVFYESPYAVSFGDASTQGPLLLERALDAAEAVGGIEVWAWFEYGLIAEFDACERAYCRAADEAGWRLGKQGGFQWLDARIPEVRTHILALLADLAQSDTRLAGIQLDDHFALPVPLAGRDAETMTAFARQLLEAATLRTALSPATLRFSKDELNVDWGAWAEGGLGNLDFDHYAVQLYRTSYRTFAPELEASRALSADDCSLVAGLRCQGTGDPSAWDELAPMIRASAEAEVGISMWYSPCSLDLYRDRWDTLEGW